MPLPPPPATGPMARLRIWRLSLGAYTGPKYWLLVFGLFPGALLAGLYVASGLTIGWKDAYDVMIGITSPGAVHAPVLSWFLSVAGWLAAPAVFGAVAGIVIDAATKDRRQRPMSEVVTKDGAPHG